MRILLGIVALLPASAGAIGMCEGTEDSAKVRALGKDRVAVDRIQEVCDEHEGEERRRRLAFVEILDQAGNVIERYVGENTSAEELEELVGPAKPAEALKAALAELQPATPAPNARCKVKPVLKEGALLVVISATDSKGPPLHVQDLTDQVDPSADVSAMIKTFWLPSGVVFLEANVPLLIDQGALGTAQGQLSAVAVLGPEVVPALAVCAEAKAAAPAAPASVVAPATVAPAVLPTAP